MNIKIINDDIKNCLSNEECIYIKLDYNNPIIKDKKIAYPILNMYYEKTSIDTVDELKIKIPQLPNLDTKAFVNIVKFKNDYKILILKEPIRCINNKVAFNNFIDDIFYVLKNDKWDKNKNDVSFKSSFNKEDIDIIYSNYDIYDNNGLLFFKKNNIDNFYQYLLEKIK